MDSEGGGTLERLLVGFDGSDGGRDALALAKILSPKGTARVTIVTVFPYGPLPIAFVALHDEAARDAEPLFDEARKVLGDAVVETHAFGGGSAAWVISRLAEEGNADAIVVGSPHRGVVGRVLLGSVATNLLTGAPCHVAVAPRGFAARAEDRSLSVIAVAYDGTPEAAAALHLAEAQALATGASIRLLTVLTSIAVVPAGAGYVPVDPPDPDKVLARGLSAINRRVEAEGRRLNGPVAPTLAAACEDDVDLLVVGSRGYGPVLRVILGSSSRELVRDAPCPVIVTPRPGTDAPGA